MSDWLQTGINFVEAGVVPDFITRMAIHRLCAERAVASAEQMQASQAFLDSLNTSPIALFPAKANEQHYELPPEFFALVLGPQRKYSCCYFESDDATLAEAETAALEQTCRHAQLQDGQTILELGCGWGSLSLWMAEHYPRSRIVAVSNSASQRRFIETQAQSRSLANLQVCTADMNDFSTSEKFDRVVSVEMFEHLRNYELVLRKIAGWLNPDGALFVHHFCHRELSYPFEVEGTANWMGRYFFTGGQMPHAATLSHFPRDLKVVQRWDWSGDHYQRTADAWLALLDANRSEVLKILKSVYGPRDARRWFHRWRMFFLAVSELFGYAAGKEWFVTHQLLRPAVADVPQVQQSSTDLVSRNSQ